MLTEEQAEQIRAKLLEQVEKLPPEKAKGLKEQILAATPEQLEAYVKPQQVSCLFCGIAQGKVETVKVYEDSNLVAFLDITPLHAGQVIIAPKEHYEFLFQVPDQVIWEIIKIMKVITPIIVNITGAQGVSTYFAQGQAAGQTMDHISFNIIPRIEGDKASFAWERNQVEKSELEDVGRKIMEAIAKSLLEEREALERKVREKVEEEKAKAREKPFGFPRRRA